MSLEADIRRWFRVFPQNQKQVFNDVENFKFLYGLGLDDINFYSMFLTIANERFSEKVITKREYDIAYKQVPTYLFYKLLSSGVYQNQNCLDIIKDNPPSYTETKKLLVFLQDDNDKFEVINCCVPIENQAKLLNENLISPITFIQLKTVTDFIGAFCKDGKSKKISGMNFKYSRTLPDINNIDILMDALLSLKTDNLYEQEKLKLLSVSMFYNSEIQDIFTNRPLLKMFMKDEHDVIDKIKKSYQPKLEQLLELLETTNNREVYRDGLYLLTNHVVPIGFDINSYKNRIYDLLKRFPHYSKIKDKLNDLFKTENEKEPIKYIQLNDELYSQIIRNFQLVIPEKLQQYKNCCFDFPVDKLDLIGCQAMLTSCAHLPHMRLVNVDYSDKNRKSFVNSLLKYGMIDRIDLLTFKHDGLMDTANLMLKNGEIDVKIYEHLNSFLSEKTNSNNKMRLI